MHYHISRFLSKNFSPGYSFPADIWSCGVLMAILLTGSSPFYHRREIVMLRSIMEARYSMEGPDWTGISKNAKILIKQMLTLDQSKRITAKEVLYFIAIKNDYSTFRLLMICGSWPR